MKMRACSTGTDWTPLASSTEEPSEDEKASISTSKTALARALTDVLISENLIVVSGLGTSLAIKDADGERVAPTMASLWQSVESATGNDFEKIKADVHFPDHAGDDVELLLSHCQMKSFLEPNEGLATFVEEAERAIASECNFIAPTLDLSLHETFLRKVAKRPTRHPRARIFTTNYDLCFEQAATSSGFIFVDGFSHTEPRRFDGSYFSYDFVRRDPTEDRPDFIPNVFHLYKIHGSLDWERLNGGVVKRSSPERPLLIYPRIGKFESSFEQPFLEIISRLQIALREPNTGLLVVGFGFNDRHITEPILSAVRSNVGLKLVVVDPVLESSQSSAVSEIRALIDRGDPRLTLLECGFEQLVPMLPDISSPSEEERHRERLLSGAT